MWTSKGQIKLVRDVLVDRLNGPNFQAWLYPRRGNREDVLRQAEPWAVVVDVKDPDLDPGRGILKQTNQTK